MLYKHISILVMKHMPVFSFLSAAICFLKSLVRS